MRLLHAQYACFPCAVTCLPSACYNMPSALYAYALCVAPSMPSALCCSVYAAAFLPVLHYVYAQNPLGAYSPFAPKTVPSLRGQYRQYISTPVTQEPAHHAFPISSFSFFAIPSSVLSGPIAFHCSFCFLLPSARLLQISVQFRQAPYQGVGDLKLWYRGYLRRGNIKRLWLCCFCRHWKCFTKGIPLTLI